MYSDDVLPQSNGRHDPKDLMRQLDQLTTASPDQFDMDSVARVRRFIQFEIDKPVKGKPYRFFKDVADYELYFKLHPEWQGRSPSEMQYDVKSGASGYYASFLIWVRREAGSDRRRNQELRRKLFSSQRFDRKILMTIDDWKQEFQIHPEWQGKAAKEMERDPGSGAQAFYAAFTRWANREAQGERKKRRMLMREIFPLGIVDRVSNTSISDWVNEFNRHPEWKGRIVREMLCDAESGAGAFYSSFIKWVKKTAETKDERQAYMRAVFQNYNAQFSRSRLDVLGDISTDEAREALEKLLEE